MLLTREPSDERARAGRDRRSPAYLPTSSVAKWAASAALPPFPHMRSFPPPFRVATISWPAASISGRIFARDSRVRTVAASDFSNVIPPSKPAPDPLATEFFGALPECSRLPGAPPPGRMRPKMARMTSRQLWTAKLRGEPAPSRPAGPRRAAVSAGELFPKRAFIGVVLGIDPSLRGTGLALVDF